MFDRAYSIINNKEDLTKKTARIRQNVNQESVISETFKRATNNHSLSPSKQQTQATDIQEDEIKMSINLPHIEGTREKLRGILGSHKVRFTFYTEITLHKLLCKPRDRVATEVREKDPL